MTVSYIAVSPDRDRETQAGAGLVQEAHELGFTEITDILPTRIYWIEGDLSDQTIETIAEELLADPVSQQARINGVEDPPYPAEEATSLLVRRKPGVMDPAAISLRGALRRLDLETGEVRTGTHYWIRCPHGQIARKFARTVLANEVIEDISTGSPEMKEIPEPTPYVFEKKSFPFRNADLETLKEWNKNHLWSLDETELRTIQSHFQANRNRDPTDLEVETIAQTWSEHCKHKTLTGTIEYGDQTIENLLRETIVTATEKVDDGWCLTVFDDNAGAVGFTEEYGIAFKVETHNHPSAIEPYGGAGTGIGGVIRDVLGYGLGATPIMNTDVFCVAPPDFDWEDLPENTHHPRRTLKGVVSGVRDYGNRMGIPTGNGAVYFDDRYVANPLVFCGNVGRIPRDKVHKEPRPGDRIVTIGGKTGRDGIHGATFSSAELDESTEEVAGGAVQIGNAITEKRMAEAIREARDRGLYTCITDCGAGGYSSAVGETAEETGAEVHLEKVPLKYEGLSYTEIWISESQERMVLAVPEEHMKELQEVCEREGVEATEIGKYTDTQRLVVKYRGKTVGDLDMEFLHHGLPNHGKKAIPPKPVEPVEDPVPEPEDYGEALHHLLSSWNICSRHWIIRQYDHEVQGRTILKPLVGANMDGPGDACVLQPVPDSHRGLSVGCGMSPRYGDKDPYQMAANGIDEAVRNVVATGANPDRIALLDNFAWGSPERPEELGKLVEAAKACHDIAVNYKTPFISGKDSLYNEYEGEDGTIIIPPTLLISAAGRIPDLRNAVSMDWKGPGNDLFLVGKTRDELGGSEYENLMDGDFGTVPHVRPEEGNQVFQAIHRATKQELLASCHDLSEGGLAVAAAESAFAGNTGAKIDINSLPGDLSTPAFLFSQSPSRFLVEVPPENRPAFEKTMREVPLLHLGTTTEKNRLNMHLPPSDTPTLSESLDDLKQTWREPLDWE